MSNRIIFALILCLSAFPLHFAQSSYNTQMHEGNQRFERGDFQGSTSSFSKVVKENEKDFGAHYNLGNSLYREGKFEEAKAEFEKAQELAQTKEHQKKAHYNKGNALMKLGDFDSAAQEYKKTLKLDPYNEQARRNYEIALLKEKEEENKNSGGSGGGGENQEKGQEKDPNGNSQNGGSNPGGEDGTGGKDPNSQQKAPQGMPKDKQQALLNSIEGKEGETARRILNKNTFSEPRSNAKDW